jgi:hypothetical protein
MDFVVQESNRGLGDSNERSVSRRNDLVMDLEKCAEHQYLSSEVSNMQMSMRPYIVVIAIVTHRTVGLARGWQATFPGV